MSSEAGQSNISSYGDYRVNVTNVASSLQRAPAVEGIAEANAGLQVLPSSTAPKLRPLDLSDNFKIVGGVPAFTFNLHSNSGSALCAYDISSDGTRVVILDNTGAIVYDATDNFSVFAVTRDLDTEKVRHICFWKNHNNFLIVVMADSRVVTLKISQETSTLQIHSSRSLRALGIMSTFRVDALIDNFQQRNDLVIHTAFFGTEIWMCGTKTAQNGVFHIASLIDGRFSKTQMTAVDFVHSTYVYMSVAKRALLATEVSPQSIDRNKTRLFCNLHFEDAHLQREATQINGKSFGWSFDGKYFLIWKIDQDETSHMELYSYDTTRQRGENAQRDMAVMIGSNLMSVKAEFLDQQQFRIVQIDNKYYRSISLVAILVAHASGIWLQLWDLASKEIVKQIHLTMKEMEVSENSHIDYCISNNMKWVGVGCWNDGLVLGLFSLSSETLVWSTKLDSVGSIPPSVDFMKFDRLDSRLFVNVGNQLYVFAPPCLVKDYNLEFRSFKYRVSNGFDKLLSRLPLEHQRLIPKKLLYHLLSSELEVGTSNHTAKLLDVANSANTSRVVALVREEETLVLYIGTFKHTSTDVFRTFLKELPGVQKPPGIEQIRVTSEYAELLDMQDSFPYHVFLYHNIQKNDDSIAVFYLDDGIFICFVSLDRNEEQVTRWYPHRRWFQMDQSQDGSKVTCLGDQRVIVFGLNERQVLYEVSYTPEATQWLNEHLAPRSHNTFSFAEDGKSVLVGWDNEHKRGLFVTPLMKPAEIERLTSSFQNASPCWALDENLEKLAHIEFDGSDSKLSAICVYECQTRRWRQICKVDWTLYTARILNKVTLPYLVSCTLKMKLENGYLCFIVNVLYNGIVKVPSEECFELICVPLGPYSIDVCVPSLCMIGYPERTISSSEIERLILKFGTAFYQMPFNGVTNFQLVLTISDKRMLSILLKLAIKHDIYIDQIWIQKDAERGLYNILAASIKEKNEEIVKLFMHGLETHFAAFEQNAIAMKECFQDLWKDYRMFIEPLIVQDDIGWVVHEVEIPSDVFTKNEYVKSRVGTCKTMKTWKPNHIEREALYSWRTINASHLEEIEQSGSPSTTRAKVKVFCIDNVCKIGFNGILRFLLMQSTSTCMFKTPLVKTIVTWKWEHTWKERYFKMVVVYVLFLVGFSTYAMLIASFESTLKHSREHQIAFLLLLLVLAAISLFMMLKEFTQLRTYMDDGRKVFPNEYYWGVRYYLRSRWNVVKSTTYIVMLIVLPTCHVLSMFDPSHLKCLHSCIAIEAILIWIQIWYFALASKKSGPLVLMIENVVKDCIPFLVLAMVILVGFGLALFVLFQYSINNGENELHEESHDEHEGEIRDKTKLSFGSIFRTMSTLFCAMIGTFDIEVYYSSGSLSVLITLLFVLFLAMQLVSMLNLLIALMSDTFDRVKRTEEEHLLLGRARFIDSCEASLNQNEIEQIEANTDRYLYVLEPVEKKLENTIVQWKGRTKTIEQNIKAYMDQLEESILSKTVTAIEGVERKVMKQEQVMRSLHEQMEQLKAMMENHFSIENTHSRQE